MRSADHDPPSPRRRTAVVVTLAVLVVLAGAVAAAVLVTRRSDRATPSSGHPTETPVAARYTGDLRQLLLARPATAELLTDPISADGTLSLDQAAKITHPEAEAKLQLQAFGFQHGAVAQWRDGDAEVTIWLFQFASTTSTLGYRDALDETFAPSFFDQPATPVQLTGGHVYVSKRALDERGLLGTATAVRGDLLMIVTRYQPTSVVGPLMDLATSQDARLPA